MLAIYIQLSSKLFIPPGKKHYLLDFSIVKAFMFEKALYLFNTCCCSEIHI